MMVIAAYECLRLCGGESFHVLQVRVFDGRMPDGSPPVVVVDMAALDRAEHVGGVRLPFDLLLERFDEELWYGYGSGFA